MKDSEANLRYTAGGLTPALLRARIPDGYGDTGFQATALIFPTEGCGEVTGEVGETSLTLVTRVVKVGERGPQALDRLVLAESQMLVRPAPHLHFRREIGIHERGPAVQRRANLLRSDAQSAPQVRARQIRSVRLRSPENRARQVCSS